jgi:hypothetical protein
VVCGFWLASVGSFKHIESKDLQNHQHLNSPAHQGNQKDTDNDSTDVDCVIAERNLHHPQQGSWLAGPPSSRRNNRQTLPAQESGF